MMMMMTMTIPMMPDAMTVPVVTISPPEREFPRREGVSSLCYFRHEEAAENFYEVAPR